LIKTPPKVVISEFLEIAKSFFPNGKECKLANGVLDKLATEILSN
jgi:N utilization substance protein B